jgi:hypothetical protein
LLHVERHCVDEVHLVAESEQPRGVNARTAPHVQHDGRRLRSPCKDEGAGAVALDDARSVEAPCFDAQVVVLDHVRKERHGSER